MILNKLWLRLLDLIYPARCEICGKLTCFDEPICEECLAGSKPFDGYCKRCGFKNCKCEEALSYDEAFCMWEYSGRGRDAVLSLKQNECIALCEYFAEKAADNLKGKFDAVCFAPMTSKRKRQSGFNQAELIAGCLSKKLMVKKLSVLLKVKNYRHHDLDRAQRKAAAKDAYRVKNGISLVGKRILLCDDIITTGSTLNECAAVLKQAGAEYVAIACIANAEGESDKTKESDKAEN